MPKIAQAFTEEEQRLTSRLHASSTERHATDTKNSIAQTRIENPLNHNVKRMA
jgi:hypothetical protein